MKKLLILTAVGTLLLGVSGCRFWNCLWRGPAYQTVTPACPTVCPPSNPCDPSYGATGAVMPGPETYAPTR